jgi:hypothetical protein
MSMAGWPDDWPSVRGQLLRLSMDPRSGVVRGQFIRLVSAVNDGDTVAFIDPTPQIDKAASLTAEGYGSLLGVGIERLVTSRADDHGRVLARRAG